MPVDAAVTEARKAVSFSARNSVEWATPVLFMSSSDGALFDIDKTVPVAPLPSPPKPKLLDANRTRAAVGVGVLLLIAAVAFVVRPDGGHVTSPTTPTTAQGLSLASTDGPSTDVSDLPPSPAVAPIGRDGRQFVSAAEAWKLGLLRSNKPDYGEAAIAIPSELLTVEASSTLPRQGAVKYDATNLIDRNLATAWAEGVGGLGVGSTLRFSLAVPMQVDRIEVWPGWQTTIPCWSQMNARPTQLTATANPVDGDPVTISSAPTGPDPQSRLAIDLPHSGTYSEITLTIDAVAAGTKCNYRGPFDDTNISEIRFFGYDFCGGINEVADGEWAIRNGELVPIPVVVAPPITDAGPRIAYTC